MTKNNKQPDCRRKTGDKGKWHTSSLCPNWPKNGNTFDSIHNSQLELHELCEECMEKGPAPDDTPRTIATIKKSWGKKDDAQ